jgi:hypothetical protein
LKLNRICPNGAASISLGLAARADYPGINPNGSVKITQGV